MALGQLEAVEQLRQEINGGQELSGRLWELLSQPLDSGGREAALEMIKQISRVFMVTQLMLKPGDSSRAGEARMVAPEVTTERSIGRRSLTKDKRICSGSEDVTPPRNGSEQITALPPKDGCIWRKYGQKNIQKRTFPRYYYKCMFSHQRGCRAKKRVQRQDSSSGAEGRPTFQITYVNEHTCQGVLLPDENTIPATNNTPTRNAGYAGSSFAPPDHVAEFDNDALVSCLAMVLSGAGAAAPSSSSSSFLPPPRHVQASMCGPASSYGRHSSTSLLEDLSMGLDDEMATEKEASFFSCGSPFPFTAPIAEEAAPSSLPSPAEAIWSDPAAYDVAAGGEYWPSLDQMAEMNFSCRTLFPPVEEARFMGYPDGMSRGSWTQVHQEQPGLPSDQLPPAASSSSLSSVAWPVFDVDQRWG